MNQEDFNADMEMCFRQIISLTDLMLELDNENAPNILTIRDLAQAGLNNFLHNMLAEEDLIDVPLENK